MIKFRIRLDSGRVIGPFVVSEFSEIVKKASLTGQEEVQEFPIGDWGPLNKHPELLSQLDKVKEKTYKDSLLKNLDELEEITQTKNQVKANRDSDIANHPEEFKYEKKDPFSNLKTEHVNSSKKIAEDKDEEKKEEGLVVDDEKTVIRRSNITEEIDKTVINPNYVAYLKEEEQRKALKLEEEALAEEEEKIEVAE